MASVRPVSPPIRPSVCKAMPKAVTSFASKLSQVTGQSGSGRSEPEGARAEGVRRLGSATNTRRERGIVL